MRHKPLVVLVALAAVLLGGIGAHAGIEEMLKEPLTEARHQAHEAVERNVKIDLLEKIGAPMPFEGVVNISGSPEPKTLYFHSQAPAAVVDELNEFTASSPGPFMDPNPPTDPTPSVATNSGAGNLNFRKNPLNAYWGGKVAGVVNSPTIGFWISAPATEAEVAIFGDGGIGATAPVATKRVALGSPVPELASVTFSGLEMAVENELVVQISARLDPATGNQPAVILYDSPEFSSSMSFMLSPLGDLLPRLDDPIGIVHRTTDLVVANSGTGHVVITNLAGVVQSVAVGGIVPGGFARGVTGLAADAAGTIYYAVAETGDVHFAPTAGVGGVYARGLGAVTGIAFDASGNLFVADAAAKRIIRIAPSGMRLTLSTTFPAAPYALAFAPDGTLAVSTQRDGKVYSVELTTAAKTEIASLGAGHSAEGLAYAASGNLYIGDGRAGRLVRRTTAGALEEVRKDLGGPLSLAYKPSSNLLALATQGEGRPDGDAILEVDVGEAGLAPATPTLTPTALPSAPQTWVHQAGARALEPTTGIPGISAEARYHGKNGFEPTVAVQTAAGGSDVFTTGGDFDQAGGVLGSPKVYRSRDNGHTWADVTPKDLLGQGQDAPPITLDPYIYVDETTNRIFNPELLAGCIYLNYSDDDGDTWETNPIGCGVPPVDHQTLVAGKPRLLTTDGYPNVLYHCSNWVAFSPCGRSLDGGKTWQPAGIAQAAGVADIYRAPQDRTPEDLGVSCSSLTGHVSTDADGRVFLPRIACTRPIVSVTEDDGLTWNTYLVDPANAVGGASHESIVAADAAGTVYYAWIGRNRLPYISSSTDHGKTWGPAKMVAPPGVTEANLPSIAAGGAGEIAVLYMGTTVDYGYTARNYGKASWNVYMTVTDDATAVDPVFQTTTVTPLGDPMIRAACGPGRCGNVFDFLDIVIDSTGRAWATFVDACTGPCAGNRSAASTDAKGGVAPLMTGPNLRGSGDLPALP